MIRVIELHCRSCGSAWDLDELVVTHSTADWANVACPRCNLNIAVVKLQESEPLIPVVAAQDLVRRLLAGWGSDSASCNPENWAAYEAAQRFVNSGEFGQEQP